MLFRIFFFVAIFHNNWARCRAQSVIWNKNHQKFFELLNTTGFAEYQVKSLSEQKDYTLRESYNLMGEVIKVTYFEDKNLVMFSDNNTKVTGICGDVWTLLAEYLNFTLVPVQSQHRHFGERLKNGSFTGLLGLLYDNDVQVILRSGMYAFRAHLLDYTVPFWMSSYRMYIKPEYEYDETWIISIFSRYTWYCIFIIFAFLCVVGYASQKAMEENNKVKQKNEYYTFGDHIFYNTGLMFNQGYLPDGFHDNFKILTISKSFFAWLILVSFGAHLIYRMTNRTMTPPFTTLDNLLNSTNYKVVAFRGSMVYESLKKKIRNVYEINQTDMENRIQFMNDPISMYHKVCYNKGLYMMFESEDKIKINKFVCQLKSVGKNYYQTWIGSATLKGFKNKEVIHSAIIKLREVGLMDRLRHRWLNYRLENKISNTFKMVDLEQVTSIFAILPGGAALSILILFVEKIKFFFEKKWK